MSDPYSIAVFDHLCRELPSKLRRLAALEDRQAARKIFGETLATMLRIGTAVLAEGEAAPPMSAEEAFAAARKLALEAQLLTGDKEKKS